MTLHNKYGHAPRKAYQNEDLRDPGDVGTTIKVALLNGAHTPDLNNHQTWADVSADEVTGTNYTAGGQEIANDTFTYDAATGTSEYDGDDVVWTDSTITAGYAVVYDDTGTATTSTLLTLVDFEGTQSSDAGDFTISWDATNGIFQLQTP